MKDTGFDFNYLEKAIPTKDSQLSFWAGAVSRDRDIRDLRDVGEY